MSRLKTNVQSAFSANKQTELNATHKNKLLGPRSISHCIQLFRERLSNKTVRDNAERYYG